MKTPPKLAPRRRHVFIEVSGRCDGRCPYCARRRLPRRNAGAFMPPALFDRILGHLDRIGLLPRGQDRMIQLFNWGEPLLHPEFEALLRILKRRGLPCAVSSNLLHLPPIDPALLPVMKLFTFSLSGFSQKSYGRVHGAELKTALAHFEDLYRRLRDSSPGTELRVAWHRYTFNEPEFWKAQAYFDRPGIRFCPTPASFNDLLETLSYAQGRLPEQRRRRAAKELFLDHLAESLARHRGGSARLRCFMWDSLVIDERGRLFSCCGMTEADPEYILGDVLEMSAAEILRRKAPPPVCRSCIAAGIPQAFMSGALDCELPPPPKPAAS